MLIKALLVDTKCAMYAQGSCKHTHNTNLHTLPSRVQHSTNSARVHQRLRSHMINPSPPLSSTHQPAHMRPKLRANNRARARVARDSARWRFDGIIFKPAAKSLMKLDAFLLSFQQLHLLCSGCVLMCVFAGLCAARVRRKLLHCIAQRTYLYSNCSL